MNYRSIKLSILTLALATPFAFAGNSSFFDRMAGQTKNVPSLIATKDGETAKKEYDNTPGTKVVIPDADSLFFRGYSQQIYDLNQNDSLYEKVHFDYKATNEYLHFPYLFFHEGFHSGKWVFV